MFTYRNFQFRFLWFCYIIAMGLTFIAFEGYDLIATVAEEIKAPETFSEISYEESAQPIISDLAHRSGFSILNKLCIYD